MNRNPITIPNGEALSNSIGSAGVSGIIMPAEWTAASLTFQGSHDGVTFVNIRNDSGDEYVIPADASWGIVLSAPLPFRHIKVRSGTSGTPVNQAAERTLELV